jgi:hypothetical protein
MPILVEHVFSLIAVVLMNRSHIQNQKTCHFPDWVLQMVDGSQTLQNINAPQQCLITTGAQSMLLTGQQIHPIGMIQRHRLQPTHATYAFPRICNGSHQRDPRRRKKVQTEILF